MSHDPGYPVGMGVPENPLPPAPNYRSGVRCPVCHLWFTAGAAALADHMAKDHPPTAWEDGKLCPCGCGGEVGSWSWTHEHFTTGELGGNQVLVCRTCGAFVWDLIVHAKHHHLRGDSQ